MNPGAPGGGGPRLSGIGRLLEIVATLRGEKGCPWDREQTLESLKPHLIEEAYELLDSLDSGDAVHHREELGDLLLQVLLQSRIREEQGEFDFDAVAQGLADKLVRRHPHVFGDVQVAGSADVLKNWERIKGGEKAGTGRGTLDGLPRQLPALFKAQRIQGRAARVGFDWEHVGDVVGKVEEELGELKEAIGDGDEDHIREELGDLLFAVVNLGRFRQIDVEEALQAANRKFVNRFHAMEKRIRDEGRRLEDCTLAEMDAHWEAVKRQARSGLPNPAGNSAGNLEANPEGNPALP